MNKGQHDSYGIGNEIYQLQLVVIQQAAEEISHWEVEAALKEGREDDLLLDIFTRELLPSGSPPLHFLLGSEQLAVHQSLDFGLGHR
jgi:hypothetical protein